MTNECDCKGSCQMPDWVTQAQHWHHMRRVGWTTPEERRGVRNYRPGKTYACHGGCGLVFAAPTLCFWCRRRGFDALRRAMETISRAVLSKRHKPDCAFRIAETCAVPIECEHGYDVCPQCDPCTCSPTRVTV